MTDDKLRLELKLKEDVNKIKKKILEQAGIEIRRTIANNLTPLTSRIKESLEKNLQEAPEYKGMVYGDLRGHFGFYEGTERSVVNGVVRGIVDAVEVQFLEPKTSTARLQMIRIGLVPKDYSYLYQLQEAYVGYTNKDGNGTILPWLNWLLERGDEVIIDDYRVNFLSGLGRSGIAIMIKPSAGGFWKVPSWASGTENDNWITRAIVNTDFGNELNKAIQSIFRT